MIVFVDMYCGCGGMSTGFHEACQELRLPYREIAINHWLRAIETMRANHPDVLALKMDIEAATSKDIGVKVIDLLHASPSCTHHSRAKGGKPCDDQLRSQPNEIWKFVDNIHVRRITIENVPEFVNWGPLTKDGRPIKRKMGDCFRAWLQQFTARGYTYEWRILNCADYGDATTRSRFFLQAVKQGCGKIRWPEPTHEENPQPDLFGRTLKRWRGICECLDYSDMGRSIFGRKDPIAEKTLRRVSDGLRKYCKISLPLDVLMSSNPRVQKCAVQCNQTFHYSKAEIAGTDIKIPCNLVAIPWDGYRMGEETGQKKIHPHQKPVALYRWILATYGRKAKRIFDPFAGSGSLAVACKQLGKEYIGCEIDQTFYKAAYSRIFDNPPPQPLEEFLPFMANQKVD